MGIGKFLIGGVILIEAVGELLLLGGQATIVGVVEGRVENFGQFGVFAACEGRTIFAISVGQRVTRCDKFLAIQPGSLIAREIGGIDDAVPDVCTSIVGAIID